MENNKWVSSIPACNMIIAILIFAQLPIMFGTAPAPNAVIYALPWLLAAYPVILLCVAIMFKNGDFVDATMNAILSGVLMGQNFVRGIIALTLLATGKEPSVELLMSSASIDMWVYIVGGIILFGAGWLAHFNSKMAAIGVWSGAIGFWGFAAAYAGFGIGGLIGAIGMLILGLYLLYSGLAMLINMTIQKEVLPIR